ncbi:MAG: pseudaminic acid synthase [Deltaproteobacteria bacterium]|uniref:Pseudaminic acid synthase n=1 Tax=Candidatus Zymogenus saltonus TaxID=2844893 RepID=A0A9D8KG82_9DELT|nr:pseudaminic acid synthase [Candidatus Zymogenus saltonus]
MIKAIEINDRSIGLDLPVYIIAEMSANHNQDFDQAVKIVKAAKEAGADAVKLQTYTADTLTISSDKDYFKIKGTIWEDRNLFDLYGEAHMPWEWQPRLKKIADDLGITLFSTPFDDSAVEFLEEMDVPAYKVASFEVVDIPLLKRIGKTGKPVIMSTGMATLSEIDEAVKTIREAGCLELALLHCVSAYPAPPEEMNLRTIPHMREAFGVPVGLSDHTLGISVPIAAVALGACIIEKHFTLSRDLQGPDSTFSLEPHELRSTVEGIRTIENAIGSVDYNLTDKEKENQVFRRSLFVVKDIKAGEFFTSENVRSIRPGHGLHTRYLEVITGRRAARDIEKGTPLTWELIG